MTYQNPALNWLIKHDPDAALAVFHRLRDNYYAYGSESKMSHMDPKERSADDVECVEAPELETTSETMWESAQDGPDEICIEMIHSVSPELHEMLRSAGGIAWPWCGVQYRRDGKVRWRGEPWAYEFLAAPSIAGRHLVSLKGLTFYTRPGARRGLEGGMLLAYLDDAGCVQRPVLKANKPRGGKRPYRENPAGYLALPGATPSPLSATGWRRPLSKEPALAPMFDPQAGTQEARAILERFGIDGSVPFEALPFPATKCPTRIARNARFIGGMSGRCQTASIAAVGKSEELEPLAPSIAAVLEEVAARGTLKSIGRRLGFNGGYADRAGKRALLAAGRELVAANDNSEQKKLVA